MGRAEAGERPSADIREHRKREFLDAALRIVTTEGLSELTIKRLAVDVGCAVGLVYRYFPSKDALVAEVQRESIERVHRSLVGGLAAVDEAAERQQLDATTAALVRVVGAGRFWVAAEEAFPHEIELSRRVFTDPVLLLDAADAMRAVPATMAVLDLARNLLDDAVATGALREGTSMERAVVIITASTGVLMVSGLMRWAPDVLDGQRLARGLLHDLLVAWGADPDQLAVAEALVAEIHASGGLVPPVT